MMRFVFVCLSFLGVLHLTACQRKSPPAPVEVGHGIAGGQPYTLDLKNIELKTGTGKKVTKIQTECPDFVIVKAGETLYSIASQYKVSGAKIITLNNLQAPYRLEVGQKIYLKKQSFHNQTESTAAASPAFIWPVQGRIITGYGENGNEGVNIAAPKNTPVYATQSGKISYVGNDLEDFGNMVLMTHTDNWRSAYAHLARSNVRQDEEVKRGQVIGYVGHSGSVKTPQVHFELRQGSESVDPRKYLK